MKKNILMKREEVAPATRDHDYDGMVTPCYNQYPHNTEACVRITTPIWNPPAQLVGRLVEMCLPEAWEHTGLTRVICPRPLDMGEDGPAVAML